MHKPHHHGHTAKHIANHKHHHHHLKHHPVHHRKIHHHVSAQHVAGKSPHHHKPRHLSYGISCVLEALADTADFAVTDADLMNLFQHMELFTIEEALKVAAEHGLAGHYPEYSESDYFLPGCIVGMSLPEGQHAAVLTEHGVNMWDEIIPMEDFNGTMEEAWNITWL
jgi:hypothetical protein